MERAQGRPPSGRRCDPHRGTLPRDARGRLPLRPAQHPRLVLRFGLSGLTRDRLEAVIADGNGPLPHLVDMLHLLKQVSRDEGVRAWLSASLAPLGPASSDAPWGLEDALLQVDRLEAIASRSPSNLYLYEAEQLRRLEAPGLGKRIAARLWDASRAVTVRKLLLDIAIVLGAREAVEPALSIALDASQAVALREWATILVQKLGEDEDVRRLEAVVARSRGKTRGERELRAQAPSWRLLESGLWTVAEAARHAPPEHPNVISTPSMLFYEMERRVTADDARLILMHSLETRRRNRSRAQDAPRPERRQRKLVRACTKKLLEATPLSRSDQRLLSRVAVRAWHGPNAHDLYELIVHKIGTFRYAGRWMYCCLVESIRKGRKHPP